MKKLKVISIFLAIVVLLYMGAYLHAPLLSLVDGVHPLDRSHGMSCSMDWKSGTSTSSFDPEWTKSLSTPKGFSISPEKADFIFSSLLDNAWHWGASATSYLYVDSESYYLIETFPGNVSRCSFNAKRFGVRIHGNTGKVWDPLLKQWENKGYIDLTRATFVSTVTNGMTDATLNNTMGKSFSSLLGVKDKDGRKYDIHHYWCKDGEVIISLQNNSVINVSTNINFVRI
jgi:hypothetical protein